LGLRASAKSFELRAAMSLVRLLAKQNRREEARAKIAEIYGRFTEGFDTADLRDAKTLREELNEIAWERQFSGPGSPGETFS
jgi:predicted ATPase